MKMTLHEKRDWKEREIAAKESQIEDCKADLHRLLCELSGINVAMRTEARNRRSAKLRKDIEL